MDQRFATWNCNHRGATFIHRIKALLNRQALVQDRIRIVDLAAASTSEIAAKQGFQHQNERIALAAPYLLSKEIGSDLDLFEKWHRHEAFPRHMVCVRALGGHQCRWQSE